MSSKVVPHLWVPTPYIRVLFCRHLCSDIRNNLFTEEQLLTIVKSVYAANKKLIREFDIPNAHLMAKDLLTINTGKRTSNFYVESYKWLMDNVQYHSLRKVTDVHTTELRKHLLSIGTPLTLRRDKDYGLMETISEHTLTSMIIILLQTLKA